MSEEELEKTGILKDLWKKEDETEMTINEMLEEFQEQLDYLDIEEQKKVKIKQLIQKIKQEQEESVKEFLLKKLKKIVNDKE